MTTALEGVRGQRHVPAALYPRERPGIHCIGGWLGPRAGLDRRGKSLLQRDSIPDRPARSQSLYGLSYPAHSYVITWFYSSFLVRILPFLFITSKHTISLRPSNPLLRFGASFPFTTKIYVAEWQHFHMSLPNPIPVLIKHSKGRFAHSMPFTCRAHAVPLPCRAAKGLECVFPIWFAQCGRVRFTLAMSCPCYAPTMPFFSRPQHSTAVSRRPCCAVALRRTAWSAHGMANVRHGCTVQIKWERHILNP